MRRQLAITTDQTQRQHRGAADRRAAASSWRMLQDREADLTVRAPFDGRLVAPNLHELQGQYLQRGQEFGDRRDDRPARGTSGHRAGQRPLCARVRQAGEQHAAGVSPTCTRRSASRATSTRFTHPVGPPLAVQASQDAVAAPVRWASPAAARRWSIRTIKNGVKPAVEPV